MFRDVDAGLALDQQLCRQLDEQARAGGLELRPEAGGLAPPPAAGDEPSEQGGASDSTQAVGEGGEQQGQQQEQQLDAPQQEPQTATQQQEAQAASVEETAEDMLPLAERLGGCVQLMYVQWRDALESAARSKAAMYKATDELRVEHQVGTFGSVVDR